MKFFISLFLIFLLLSIVQGDEIFDEKVSKELLTELSGELAKEYVVNISMFDRIQASEGWDFAANYIIGKLKEFGIKKYGIDSHPSDGGTRYYTWLTPPGWKVEDGELWIVEPVLKRIACYREIPSTLVKHSCSADVERAEIVYIKEGDNPASYDGIDVKGKIVLSQSYAGNVHREAVIKRGALGVITFLPFNERDDYPELIPYQAFWPKKNEIEKVGFGFTISRKVAREIISYLESGKKVFAKAKVSGRLYLSEVKTLWAVIEGTEKPEEEIILMAHLDHYKPGANDNASGSAGLLEILRTFKRLIDEGRIPPLKRTVHFLWLNEWYSTAPYLKFHPEISKKGIVALNLDMIGENPKKIGTFLIVTKTPHSLPSFINDLVEIALEKTATLPIESPTGEKFPFFFRMVKYSGGSDHHFFNDSTVSVPSLMFNHPDPYWHTIQDTSENVDPTEMKRVIFAISNVVYFISNPNADKIKNFYNESFTRGLKRVADSINSHLATIYSSKNENEFNFNKNVAERTLKYTIEREIKSLNTIKKLFGDLGIWIEERNKYFENSILPVQKKMEEEIKEFGKERGWLVKKIILSKEEKELENQIPRRADDFRLPLRVDYIDDILGEGTSKALPLRDPILYESINFVDGKRTLLEIYERLVEEFGILDLNKFKETFEILSKSKLIEIKKKK